MSLRENQLSPLTHHQNPAIIAGKCSQLLLRKLVRNKYKNARKNYHQSFDQSNAFISSSFSSRIPLTSVDSYIKE
jgi:hypothetical protein